MRELASSTLRRQGNPVMLYLAVFMKICAARTTVIALFLALVLPTMALDPSFQRLLTAGRVDELIRAADERILRSPRDTDSYLALGRAYLALRDWDKAVAALERAVTLTPQNSALHLWLGRAYGEKAAHVNFLSAIGWAKKSRSEFERAVELDTTNVGARSDLAEFCIDAPGLIGGGIDKARKQIDVIQQQDAALGHFLRARIADKENDRTRAEQELNAAIAAGPDKARYWVNLASFYERWGRYDDMTKAIASAVAGPRLRSDVLYYAAELLLRNKRDVRLAEDLLRQYLVNPTDEVPAFEAHYLLGTLLEGEHKVDEATREYLAATTLASRHDKAKSALQRLQSTRAR